jgi:ubiquinol-cytochrome c reductase iron-sulfur subunit
MSETRRRFLALLTGLIGGIGVTLASFPFIRSWFPPEYDVERDYWLISFPKLLPGQLMVHVIENVPVYIYRRKAFELNALELVNENLLDPDSENSEQPTFAQTFHRSLNSEYFVAEGLCTHLGCAVSHMESGKEVLGAVNGSGYFCPCHGSVFDGAGRVIKGVPALKNMKVPQYEFVDEHTIRVTRS